MTNGIDLLFACTHNAGRSVAAKTLFNDRAAKLGLNLRAESARTNPGDQINLAVRRVLESFKIDTSHALPKRMGTEMLGDDPRIVTMGCEVDAESCPAVNFEEVDDWELPGPSEVTDDTEIVPLVPEIGRRVNTSIQQMTAAA